MLKIYKIQKDLEIKLEDFTKIEQEQIEKGLSTAKLTGKEASKKILALVQ